MNEQSPPPGQQGQTAKPWSDQFMPQANGLHGTRQGHLHRPLISAADIRGILFRQRWLAAITIGLALLAGLIFTLLKTPIYEATATVQIDPWGANIVEGQDIAPGISSSEVYRYMETQGSVIESKRIARQVMQKLKLADHAAFLGFDPVDDRPEGLDDDAWREMRENAAIAKLQGNVEVDVPLSNRIIPIAYRSDDPALAAQIANSYAEIFVADDVRRNLQINRYAQEYLQEQIDQTRRRVQAAELAANDYARQNGIVNQTTGADANDGFGGLRTFYGPTITASNLANINDSHVKARAERIAAQQRWLAIADSPPAQIREVQENQIIQELEQTRSELLRQLSDLRQRYNDNYPEVAELLAQLNSIDGEIARLGNDIKSAIRNEFEIALRQERGLESELEKASTASLAEQDMRVRYNLLEREAAALRVQLASLLSRYNEISTAANIQTGNASKLDDAAVPQRPISPRLLINLLVSLFMGAAMAGALMVLREAFDDRLRSFEEIEARLGFPLIGHTPFVEEGEVAQQLDDPFSPLAEAYSSILTNIDYTLPRDRNVLQFTSSQASEGKTTTALTLARALARQGRKTLLVDADLRRPSIAQHFGIDVAEMGFAEVLLGHIAQEDAYIPGTPEKLDIIPIGNIPPNPVDLLSSDKVAQFIARNRNEYSAIIFDTSPVMGIADATLIARQVDATIFVLEANRIQLGQARSSLRRLQASGGSVTGIVLSKYRALQAGESYDYQYQYYAYTPDKNGRELS